MAPKQTHETLTLIGFFLAYFAAMGAMIAGVMPALKDYWSTVWLLVLIVGVVAGACIVASKFIGNGYRPRF
jgi:hypothetical protein